MENPLKEADALIGSVGTYARIVLVGVWFPGFLVFCEAVIVYYHHLGPRGGPIDDIANAFKSVNPVAVSILGWIIVVAMSVGLGYVTREVAFTVSDRWLRSRWWPCRGLRRIFEQIRFVYGTDKVDEVGHAYHIFQIIVYDKVNTSKLPREDFICIREFCKQWLKLNFPNLNTEGLEIEINMVIGLVLPIALASVVFVTYLSALGPLCATVSAAVMLAAAAFMMYRITRVRDTEIELTIVNFLFAHWEREWETSKHVKPVIM